MKDPIQGTLDAVREVEIRIGQIRLLWSEAEKARESAQAEAHSLRVEVGRLNACCFSARQDARQVARNECANDLFKILRPGAESPPQGTYVFNTALAEVSEEINALRKDRGLADRTGIDEAHAAIWGLGCALTGTKEVVEEVREILGAEVGESTISVAERLRDLGCRLAKIPQGDGTTLRDALRGVIAEIVELDALRKDLVRLLGGRS